MNPHLMKRTHDKSFSVAGMVAIYLLVVILVGLVILFNSRVLVAPIVGMLLLVAVALPVLVCVLVGRAAQYVAGYEKPRQIWKESEEYFRSVIERSGDKHRIKWAEEKLEALLARQAREEDEK